MTDEKFLRGEMLLGKEAMQRLQQIKVAVFGLGGVGSWAAETLVRTGVRHLTLIDFDRIGITNINRQLPATIETVGRLKADILRERLLSINPDASIEAVNAIYSPQTSSDFDLDSFDYVIDAIDSLRDKALLINNATRSRCKLFSSMGAALKTDPTLIRVNWFDDAKGCRLARALRDRFKRSGIHPAHKFKVVWSPQIVENRYKIADIDGDAPISKPIVNGSLMQVTATFGIILASLVINDC